MANRFWVGGGSSNLWNAITNTNWATTSGGANNASVPTTTDIAIFDSNSGTGNSVISAGITIAGLDCQGGTGNYAGTITHNASVTLTLNTGAANALRFSSGMTYAPGATTSLITFTHTSGTATVTSAGQKFGALTINGAGGTTQLVDALQVNAVASALLTLTAGTLDANTNTAAISACEISSSNSNTRTFTLGGTVKIGGNVGNNQTIWNTQTTTGLTFTKNSANIEILVPSTPIQGLVFTTGTLAFNGITFDALSSNTSISFSPTASTWTSFTVNAGWNLSLSSGSTLSVGTAFTWTGTQANPILVSSSAITATAAISCASGTCTMVWGGLTGIAASGGATFTATNTFNFGTNTGWSISAPSSSSLTAAAIATAVWEDLLAGGDFGTIGSVGALFTSGRVAITSNKKKDTLSGGFMFVMTSLATGLPQTGLTVTSQVSLDGGAFGATVNSVTELSNGVYILNIAAADVNGNHAMLKFTATGANTTFTEIVTQP